MVETQSFGRCSVTSDSFSRYRAIVFENIMVLLISQFVNNSYSNNGATRDFNRAFIISENCIANEPP